MLFESIQSISNFKSIGSISAISSSSSSSANFGNNCVSVLNKGPLPLDIAPKTLNLLQNVIPSKPGDVKLIPTPKLFN